LLVGLGSFRQGFFTFTPLRIYFFFSMKKRILFPRKRGVNP